MGVPTVILGVFDDENLANSYAALKKKSNKASENPLEQRQNIAVSARDLISKGSPEANKIILS
jgi:hypothetical protein